MGGDPRVPGREPAQRGGELVPAQRLRPHGWPTPAYPETSARDSRHSVFGFVHVRLVFMGLSSQETTILPVFWG